MSNGNVKIPLDILWVIITVGDFGHTTLTMASRSKKLRHDSAGIDVYNSIKNIYAEKTPLHSVANDLLFIEKKTTKTVFKSSLNKGNQKEKQRILPLYSRKGVLLTL